ncbi:MAG: lysylphosphatidylglycerol synthase transmembrane domain-containing protein [Janthinobacterium lividum]
MPISSRAENTALPSNVPAGSARQVWIWAAAALVLTLTAALYFARTDASGPVARFLQNVRSVSPLHLVLGLVAIHVGLVIRAVRWALLMPPEHRPKARTLIAPQFAGFAAVALFGRVADLARPYLVAKRTNTPLTLQIAVYSVERMLDLAATATLFSVTLLFVPHTAPHHEAFSRAGVLAFAATAFLFGFALLLRSFGERLAGWIRSKLQPSLPKVANELADRLLELQAGFATVRSVPQLALAFAWSMVIWVGIAFSYLFTAHSFHTVPQLAMLTLPAILLLMATSMGASLLQLPIVGWLTQVAALAAAYHRFFGVPPAAASLCSVLTFAVNTLSVIPPGLVLARYSGISLRDVRGISKNKEASA